MKYYQQLLAVLLVLCLSLGTLTGCGEASHESQPHEEKPVLPQTGSVLTPEPSIPEDEYGRAVWYGFTETLENPDAEITEAQFTAMLSRLVEKCGPEAVQQWESVPFVKKADDSSVFRFYSAILLLYAAEAMNCADLPDGIYPTINQSEDGWAWNEFWGLDWDRTDGWSEETFGEISAAMTEAWIDPEPMDHFHGGINFAVCRLSRATGKPLLDVAPGTYMRNMDYLTFREAAVAVVRLYESNGQIAAQLPEDEAAASVAEETLKKAEERRQAILNSATDVTYTGTAYYVSNDGSDKNDGLSPEHPWATIARVNQASIKQGDAVFFERGGTWRCSEPVRCARGAVYSAYGEGAKPRLIASPENGAGGEKWSLLDGTDNIWVFYKDMLDCGAVVLNEKTAAEKVLGFWNGTQYLNYPGPDARTIGGNFTPEFLLSQPAFRVEEQLTQDLAFFSEASSELPDSLPAYLQGAMAEFDKNDKPLSHYSAGPLYLRCDAGNPGELYDSIEFIVPTGVLSDPLPEDCTVDNLYIGFAGSGLVCGEANISVQNCELAWIGGCVTSYSFEDLDGNPRGAVRMGGALSSHADNTTITNNYIHEIYEEGFLVEIFGAQHEYVEDFVVENTRFCGNILYHAGSGLGYFNWDNEADPERMFKNFLYEDNMVLFIGLNNWSSRNTSSGFTIDGGPNLQEGCVFRNNLFFCSRDTLLYINEYHPETFPEFSGNQYLQYDSYPWLWIGVEQQKYWADDVEIGITELFGDDTGTYMQLHSYKWDKLNW